MRPAARSSTSSREPRRRGGADYVPLAERIAVFDQDGTTWVSHPVYSQALFVFDRLKELAPSHPEWQTLEPFRSVLTGDREAMSGFDEHDVAQLVAVTHAGMSAEDFRALVAAWLPGSLNPELGGPVTRFVYLPMLEVMAYLRASGYRIWLVTGGGVEFVRVYAEEVYGIPPEQVIGSSIVTHYSETEAGPQLLREPKLFFVDDGPGKAVAINLFVGRIPRVAFGNSDGDREMLRFTTSGPGARLGLLILHDDAEREFAYGPAAGLPDTKAGRFSQELLDEAEARGWIVVSMKRDWARIFRDAP